MKFAFSFCTIVLVSFSFIGDQPIALKNFKSNFVKTQKGLYVSKFEVSNLDYRIFLTDLLNNKKQESIITAFQTTWFGQPNHKTQRHLLSSIFATPAMFSILL
ncbi:MAG: hypothetical protein RLZZ420_1460 [Bacteroidota bacterium]|jgi:hypothetical protein